jgi:hypothetical protein
MSRRSTVYAWMQARRSTVYAWTSDRCRACVSVHPGETGKTVGSVSNEYAYPGNTAAPRLGRTPGSNENVWTTRRPPELGTTPPPTPGATNARPTWINALQTGGIERICVAPSGDPSTRPKATCRRFCW